MSILILIHTWWYVGQVSQVKTLEHLKILINPHNDVFKSGALGVRFGEEALAFPSRRLYQFHSYSYNTVTFTLKFFKGQ